MTKPPSSFTLSRAEIDALKNLKLINLDLIDKYQARDLVVFDIYALIEYCLQHGLNLSYGGATLHMIYIVEKLFESLRALQIRFEVIVVDHQLMMRPQQQKKKQNKKQKQGAKGTSNNINNNNSDKATISSQAAPLQIEEGLPKQLQ